MSKTLVIFIFYTMMGSIISPDTGNKDGKIDGAVQSTHEHSSTQSTHEHSSTHSSAPLPPTTANTDHGGTHDHSVTSTPNHSEPNPLHDQPPHNPISEYPLMNWLKKHTNYAAPIINLQKSSDEFFKNLHNLMLQQAHKSFPNVEAFKTNDHDDSGSKLKESFGKMLQSVKGIADHDMNQRFGKSKTAYSSLKEDPHDEHRQKQMHKALVDDLSSNIAGYFPNPITAAKKLLNRFGLMEDDGDVKPNHSEHETKDGHRQQDGKEHQRHQDHDGVKDGHVKEHSEHGEKSSFSGTNHNHSEQKIEGKHSEHIEHGHGEGLHPKEKHIDHHTNSDHHQGSTPAAGSIVENLVEAFMGIVPIHKFLT